MTLFSALMLGLVACVVGIDLLLLLWAGRYVRRRGRRVQVAIGLVAWLLETGLLTLVLLIVSSTLLPGAVVRDRGLFNMTWVEVSLTVSLLVALFILDRLWRVPQWADVGLSTPARNHGWRDCGVGLLLGLLAAGFLPLVGALGGWDRVTGVTPLSELALSLGLGALFFLVTAVFEETLYRGALFALVARVGGLPMAWVLSVLVFSLLHGLNPGASIGAIIGVAAAAIVLTLGLERTGALWLPIGFHLGWNWALGSLFGYTVSGIGLRSALQQHVDPRTPVWVTGGGFGPEASVPGIVAFALVGVAIWLYTRRRSGRVKLFPAGTPERDEAPHRPQEIPAAVAR